MSKDSSSATVPAYRFLLSGGDDISVAKMLAYGALVWSVYSLLQLLVNGVVIDEVVVPAQIIAGAVHYPQGHPHGFAYPRLFSLPNYLAALLWQVLPHPLLISGIRNFLYLLGSAMVPFSAATLLTRRPLWGHLAVVLTLTETFDRLMGRYPISVFPFSYSQGQTGLQTAVLIVVLLLAGCWRLGGLLLGLLPALHAPMAAVVWPWALLHFVFSGRLPRGRDRFRLLVAFGAGLLICLVLGLVVFTHTHHEAFQPPYDVQLNGDLIYRNFTTFTDVHRRGVFGLLSLAYLVNPVAFFSFGAFLLWDSRRQPGGETGAPRQELFWLLFFGGIAWFWVYGAGAIKVLAGHMPQYLERLMPYRFSNFTVLLLPAFTTAAIAGAYRRLPNGFRHSAVALLVALLSVAGLLLWLEGSFESPFRGRVAAKLFVVSWGLLFSMDLLAHQSEPRRRLITLLFGTAFAGLLSESGGGRMAIVFIASFLLGSIFLRVGARALDALQVNGKWLARDFLFACALMAIAALTGRQTYRFVGWPRWDVISADDRELGRWLEKNASATEPILPALAPRSELQSKTGHPVLMEHETVYLMTYIPQSAPQIGMMLRDLFGIDYSDAQQISRLAAQRGPSQWGDIWKDVWEHRQLPEWQALGRKYGFRLVRSPNTCPLNLPVALSGKFWTLYTIPASSTAGGSQ